MRFSHTFLNASGALCVACCLVLSAPADARVDIGLNFGFPGPVYAEPTYVAPPPVAVMPAPTYVAPTAYPDYYYHRHYFHGRRDFHHRH